MKIIFCLRNFLPLNPGGTEVYVASLCKGLQKNGIETLVLKPGFGNVTANEYFFENIRVVEYPESSVSSKDLILGEIKPNGLVHFENIVKDEKPDIVHFHEISGTNGITLFHYYSIKNLGIPIFTTLHLVGYVCKTNRLQYKNKETCNGKIDVFKCAVCVLHERGLKWGLPEIVAGFGMMKVKKGFSLNAVPSKLTGAFNYPFYITKHKTQLEILFFLSEKVFVLSKWFKEVLVNNNMPLNKMILLEKALPYQLKPSSKERKIHQNEDSVRLVYIGRISKVKGLDIILKALKKSIKNNWVLDIYGKVGEEDYMEDCKKIANELKGEVNWIGVIRPTEVVETLKLYDALIFPTVIQEMVGLVVMEAFAAGIPVIGSNVYGIAEQITEGKNGLLFKPGDFEALGNILNKVIENPKILDSLTLNLSLPSSYDTVVADTILAYNSVIKIPRATA